MSWSYRVLYHKEREIKIRENPHKFEAGPFLAIHEVYYNKKGKPKSCTGEIVVGDEDDLTLKSLKWILKHQLKSLKEPVLNYDNLKEEIDIEEINKKFNEEKEERYIKEIFDLKDEIRELKKKIENK